MGRNEFTIPVYYSSHIPSDSLGCEITAQAPYQVSLPEFTGTGDKVILLDGGEELINQSERNNLIRRIRNNGPSDMDIVIYSPATSHPSSKITLVPAESWEQFKCVFFTVEDRQLILLDEQNRIRGYYSLDLDEVDRLLVELEILNI